MASSALRVLILDKDPRDLHLVRSCLERITWKQMLVTGHVEVNSALAAVAERHPDLILLESQLGDENGARLLRVFRALGCAAPTIILAATGDEQSAVDALRAGAADYLPKSRLSPRNLERSVRVALDRGRIEQRIEDHRHHRETARAALQEKHDVLRACVDTLSLEMRDPIATLRHFLAGVAAAGVELPAAQLADLRRAIARCRGLEQTVGDLHTHLELHNEDALTQAARPITVDLRDSVRDALAPLIEDALADGVAIDAAIAENLRVRVSCDFVAALRDVVIHAIVASPPLHPVAVQAYAHPGGVTLLVDDAAGARDDGELATLLRPTPASAARSDLKLWREGLGLRTAAARLRRHDGKLGVTTTENGTRRQIDLVLDQREPPAPALTFDHHLAAALTPQPTFEPDGVRAPEVESPQSGHCGGPGNTARPGTSE